MIEPAQRSAAKVFAVTYLLSWAIIVVVFPRFYAPYLVWENGEETARHFVHHEEAIRIYLAGAFVHGVGMIVLLTALYVLLRPVNRGMALCAALSRVIYAVFWFIFILDVLGALRFLAGAGALRGFGPDGLAALAGAQLDAGRDAYYIGLAFNGLGSALFAWVLRLCLSLVSEIWGDPFGELVRVAADDLRLAALLLAALPQAEVAGDGVGSSFRGVTGEREAL
jgi:hypothetical protein